MSRPDVVDPVTNVVDVTPQGRLSKSACPITVARLERHHGTRTEPTCERQAAGRPGQEPVGWAPGADGPAAADHQAAGGEARRYGHRAHFATAAHRRGRHRAARATRRARGSVGVEDRRAGATHRRRPGRSRGAAPRHRGPAGRGHEHPRAPRPGAGTACGRYREAAAGSRSGAGGDQLDHRADRARQLQARRAGLRPQGARDGLCRRR